MNSIFNFFKYPRTPVKIDLKITSDESWNECTPDYYLHHLKHQLAVIASKISTNLGIMTICRYNPKTIQGEFYNDKNGIIIAFRTTGSYGSPDLATVYSNIPVDKYFYSKNYDILSDKKIDHLPYI
jgi:hypothetical protein